MYMAPECLKGDPYDTRADIYSLGIVLYEMIFGFYPYEGQNIPDLIKEIDSKEVSFMKKDGTGISQMTEELIRKMLQTDPDDRITFDELLGEKIMSYIAYIKEGREKDL